ncbi:MAG: DUF2809 domain-containing protein [Ancalomicrobiaceae bacterium]|nr:DUF2809 domain-containing protein [Ancalomicrobiaceae bacterium]
MRYALICLALFTLGLASRHYANPISDLFGKYPGDTLWAMLAFFGLGLLLSRYSTLTIAGIALAVSLSVELLKFYHAPWMIALRASTFGYLVLGHIFSVENLIAYSIGVVLAVTAEWLLSK